MDKAARRKGLAAHKKLEAEQTALAAQRKAAHDAYWQDFHKRHAFNQALREKHGRG